ncbi:MAG: PDZ domain-containing protein [Myxococcota bacterium]|mgnify:CR=1 FL=1
MLATQTLLLTLMLGVPMPSPVQPLAVAQPAAQPGQQEKNLAVLRQTLPGQLSGTKITAEQRDKMMALLAELEALVKKVPSTAVEQEAQIREYLARGGELRDLMDDAGLPDPGDLLPPGPRSRLGIQFREEPGTQRAVVQRVLPQYRADKMKMRVGDVVVSVNGAPIVFASLIETVVKAKRPYVIEVLRHGALVRLTEPKN